MRGTTAAALALLFVWTLLLAVVVSTVQGFLALSSSVGVSSKRTTLARTPVAPSLNLFSLNVNGASDNSKKLDNDDNSFFQQQQPDQCDHYYPVMLGGDGSGADDPYGLFSEEMYRKRRNVMDKDTLIAFAIPIITPFVAFWTYDEIANTFHTVLESWSNNKNWVAVDGNAYAIKIITPAINGLVVPAIAVLFATLTSMTISTLRTRQVEIRRCINVEAGELRTFEYLLASYPDDDIRDRCRQYLMQYCSRIIAESQPRNELEFFSFPFFHNNKNNNDFLSPRRGMDSEIYGVLQCLNVAAAERDPDNQIPGPILDSSYECMGRLRQVRHDRMTALQSTYPPLHYGILTILAVGECAGFLMETNQEILFFLNAVQLKVLWSMLVSTFVACFAVFKDLVNPFSGSYSVSAAVDQLYIVRLALLDDGELCTLHNVINKETEAKRARAEKQMDADDNDEQQRPKQVPAREILAVVMDRGNDEDGNASSGSSNSTSVLE
jgi:Protein of unknown function (DUF4239)